MLDCIFDLMRKRKKGVWGDSQPSHRSRDKLNFILSSPRWVALSLVTRAGGKLVGVHRRIDVPGRQTLGNREVLFYDD